MAFCRQRLSFDLVSVEICHRLIDQTATCTCGTSRHKITLTHQPVILNTTAMLLNIFNYRRKEIQPGYHCGMTRLASAKEKSPSTAPTKAESGGNNWSTKIALPALMQVIMLSSFSLRILLAEVCHSRNGFSGGFLGCDYSRMSRQAK